MIWRIDGGAYLPGVSSHIFLVCRWLASQNIALGFGVVGLFGIKYSRRRLFLFSWK